MRSVCKEDGTDCNKKETTPKRAKVNDKNRGYLWYLSKFFSSQKSVVETSGIYRNAKGETGWEVVAKLNHARFKGLKRGEPSKAVARSDQSR